VNRRSLTAAAGVAGALSAIAGISLAQQALGPDDDAGLTLSFGISSTASYTDNYNLRPNNEQSAELFDHRLSFGVQSKRQVDTFRLDVDGLLRIIEAPGADSRRLEDPGVQLSYERHGVNTTLDTSARYRLSSISFLDPLERDRDFDDDPIDETDLTLDSGEREQIDLRFGVETGLNDPLGFIFDGRYRDEKFTDTTDPDLFETETINLSGTLRMTLTSKTEARLIFDFEDYQADDVPQTDRITTTGRVGITQIVSKVDTLDARIGFRNIETDETILGTRRSETEGGFIGDIEYTRELKRGTIGTTVDINESENGRTATWEINRAMALPRGSLVLSFGLTSDVSDTLRPVGSLEFEHLMKRSQFTASINREVRTSSQSNELETTRVALGYRYDINEGSGIDLSADFAQFTEAGGPNVTDSSRANLRAAYNHDLTQDWQLSTGYEFRMEDEDGQDTATSNTIFLTVERVFLIRP